MNRHHWWASAAAVFLAACVAENASAEYIARLQRFAQRDPVARRASGRVQANPYVYATSLPHADVDPLGLDPLQPVPLQGYGFDLGPLGRILIKVGGTVIVFVAGIAEGWHEINQGEAWRDNNLRPTIINSIYANYSNEDSSQDSAPPCWGRVPVAGKGVCDFRCHWDLTVDPPRWYMRVFNCTGDAGFMALCADPDGRIADYCSRCYGIWSHY